MVRHALAASLRLAFGAVAVVSCGAPPAPAAPGPVASASSSASPAASAGPRAVNVTLESLGLDASALDRKADACTDFYRFACGGWLDRTSIPADQPAFSRSFNTIADRNEAELRAIAEAARDGKIATPAGKKVGAWYAACTDVAAIERAGTKPLEPLRKIIRGVHDSASLAAAVAALHDADVDVFFTFVEAQDYQDAQKVIGEVDQGGLGLPERDFYLRDDDKSKQIRAQYAEHVVKLSTLGGADEKTARRISTDVLRIETALARVSKTAVERRDVRALYHRLDREGLTEKTRVFSWAKYLDTRGQAGVHDINVTSLEFLAGLDDVVAHEKREALQHYLEWHLLTAITYALPRALDDERFRFVRLLTGQEKQRERWKRCVESTDGALGELLAQPWLEKRFDAGSKAAAEEMIGALRAVFGESLAHLAWMDDATRQRAKRKLDAIGFQIGYPSKWKSYDFEVSAGDFAADVLAARKWDLRRHLDKIGKPLDKEDWGGSPPQVDAFANMQKVLMVFPAGILQPPFFSKTSSPAVNLGGIGMVIGHELTHHFDDQGAEFTETGEVATWWTPEVKSRFDARGTCVAEQYSAYQAAPGVNVDGRLTLGENIADIGGLKMAQAAYRRLRTGAAETPVAEGFTEDQQFFLAYGQAWCSQIREELARTLAQTDPHSPARYRVNGVVSDVPEFGKAFGCAEGSPMQPKKACEVW